MWTVIYYKEALDNTTNSVIRIYSDSTEKSFQDVDDANKYGAYLSSKKDKSEVGYVDIYEKQVYSQGELDLDELKRQDALDKLTQEEKQLLNLN